MPAPRIQLKPEVEAAIIAGIRAGGFPQVAAEAAGVPREVFDKWLRFGSQRKSGPYKAFRMKVMQAQAQARLKAEIDVREKRPLQWLQGGPGKEKPNDPGWSATVKPLLQDNRSVNILANSDFTTLLATIMQVLAPYPDAKKAIIDALRGKDQPGGGVALPGPKDKSSPSPE
jgi:hypothetical protein